MVSSGTEATMSALRLARGFTGRDRVVKFAGCYHGHVDSLLVKAGSGAMTHGTPSSPGVPAGCTADTLVLEFNDSAGTGRRVPQSGDKIACVILEPVVGNMGVVLPEDGFLETAQRLCQKHGALLIFDEVMTGFRIGYGCALQERSHIRPDLTTLGKIVGGGMPVGAYGGRADVMRTRLAGRPRLPGGNALRQSARHGLRGRHAQGAQADDPYNRDRSPRRPELVARAGRRRPRPRASRTPCASVGSMFTLFFNPEKVVNFTVACSAATRSVSPATSGACSSAASISLAASSRRTSSRRRTRRTISTARSRRPAKCSRASLPMLEQMTVSVLSCCEHFGDAMKGLVCP